MTPFFLISRKWAGARQRLLGAVARRLTTHFTADDLTAINESHLDDLRELDSLELRRRMEVVSVRSVADHSARECLVQYGIVVIPGLISRSLAVDVATEVRARAEQNIATCGDLDTAELDSVTVIRHAEHPVRYATLAAQTRPTVLVRSDQDQGMIDVFHVDRLLGDVGRQLRSYFEDEQLLGLLRSCGYDVAPQNLNCYVNESVTRTRGFHVDSYEPQIKAFVYLNDVTVLGDGPYTYVRGSHIDSEYRRANKIVSQSLSKPTEAPIVPTRFVTPVLAPAGSMIISDQAGFHRGYPQRIGGLRLVAVMNYK